MPSLGFELFLSFTLFLLSSVSLCFRVRCPPFRTDSDLAPYQSPGLSPRLLQSF